jgi:Putative polyhydroxyalkanoic acid system protein (PHA_gran_rgn)
MSEGRQPGGGAAAGQPLVIIVPHRLGCAEAKRRIDAGIARVRPEIAAFDLNYSWQADTLRFEGHAMWLAVGGRIEVLDDAARIEIDLPWLMRLLGDTICRRVRERAVVMLEKPPGKT